jgi:Sulfatase
MHRPLGKFLASFLCVTGMAWSRPVVAADTTRPNIILVMVDDFGYECVTANGGQSYQTPVLDRLASSGIRFEQCHVQPLCTPTRVQLMTGKYNIRNYLNFGTLPRSEVTFGNLLKEAGYAKPIRRNILGSMNPASGSKPDGLLDMLIPGSNTTVSKRISITANMAPHWSMTSHSTSSSVIRTNRFCFITR